MAEPLQGDWSDLKCLLPILRVRHDEDDNRETYVDACGESMYVINSGCSSLHIAGMMDDISSGWKVECSGGHVLFMTDSSDDYDVPFELEKFHLAYRYITNLIYPDQWLLAPPLPASETHDISVEGGEGKRVLIRCSCGALIDTTRWAITFSDLQDFIKEIKHLSDDDRAMRGKVMP